MNRRYANRLIEASAIVNILGPQGPKPRSEKQVRSLAQLDPEQQRVAWTQATGEANGQPTAAHVEDVAKTMKQLISERIAVREQREGTGAAPVEKPPFSPNEFRDLRLQMKQTGVHVHSVMNFIRAIETLANPLLPLAQVAHEIKGMDTPDKDWYGQANTAKSNLIQLSKELSR